MNQDDNEYEPPTVVVYHVELTAEHVQELRRSGEITCEFDADDDLEHADRIEVVVEADDDHNHRVDELLE